MGSALYDRCLYVQLFLCGGLTAAGGRERGPGTEPLRQLWANPHSLGAHSHHELHFPTGKMQRLQDSHSRRLLLVRGVRRCSICGLRTLFWMWKHRASFPARHNDVLLSWNITDRIPDRLGDADDIRSISYLDPAAWYSGSGMLPGTRAY